MALPETAGRAALFSSCADKLQNEKDPEHASNLRQVMRVNADQRTLFELWSTRRKEGLIRCHPLEEASDFGILKEISPEKIEEALTENMSSRLHWLSVTDRHDIIAQSSTLYDLACRELFDGRTTFFNTRPSNNKMISLEILSALLHINGLTDLFSEVSQERASGSVVQAVGLGDMDYFRNAVNMIGNSDGDVVGSFARFVLDHMRTPVVDCVADRSWWSILVDKGIEVSKGGYLFQCIAAITTVIHGPNETELWNDEGFSATNGLVDRLSLARSMSGNTGWWNDRLEQVSSDDYVVCLALLVCWYKLDLFDTIIPKVEDRVAQLNVDEWRQFFFIVRCIEWAKSRDQKRLQSKFDLDFRKLSPRLSLALLERVDNNDLKRRLSRKAFRDYDGKDDVILQVAASNEIIWDGDRSDNIDWEYLSHLSMKSRCAGLRFLFPPTRNLNVPDRIAKDALSKCHMHSTQFVTICERSYRSVVAERAERVSTVSERDRWFRSEDDRC